MNWLKTFWKDPGNRLLTYFLLIGGPVFQAGIWWVDSYLGKPLTLPGVWAFAWGFYLLVFIPLSYFKRNSP